MNLDHRKSDGEDMAGAGRLPGPAVSGFWLGLATVGVLTALFCAPFLHTVFWFGDEGVLLHGADRMLHGERLYLDFFEFLPPGGFYLTAGWLALTGVSFSSARVLAILTIVGIACLTYLSCHRVSRSATTSSIVVLVWVAMSQGEYTRVSHHWFTTLFSLVALWAMLKWTDIPEGRSWPAIVSGLAGGAAAMITPHRGALALLAGFAAFTGLRRQLGTLAAYCLAAVAVPALIIMRLLAQGSLGAAYDGVIVFAMTRYGGIQAAPYGYGATSQNIYLEIVFPLAVLIAALYVARDWRAGLRDRVLRITAAFGLAGALGIVMRPDAPHIALSVPMVLPLLFHCANRLEFPTFRKRRSALLVVAALFAVLPAGYFLLVTLVALRTPALETPRGRVKLLRFEAGEESAMRRIMDLPAGDAVFFYPYSPLLPFLTGRTHPARVDLFTPDYTTPAQFQEACVSVLQRSAWIVVDHKWTIEFWKAIFPAMQDPVPLETVRFERALASGSRFVAGDGNFSLRRVTDRAVAKCGQIK